MPEITAPLRLPELAPGAWLQGPEVSLAFCRGAVVLVELWDATCIHCVRTLPYLVEWHRRYRSRGLVMVGVHTPEFELSRDPAVVAEVVRRYEVSYPILLDDERATWQRFANHYWPARYLADARGYLRYEHAGEGAYGATESWIQRLLREAGDEAPMPELLAPLRLEDAPGAVCRRPTGEVYLGYHRGRLVAPEGYRPEEEVVHVGEPPEGLIPGVFSARGRWLHRAEYLESRQPGAEIEVVAEAAGVQLVAAPAGEVEVLLDGAPVPQPLRGDSVVERDGRTLAVWEVPGMVRLLDAGDFALRHLRLRLPQSGTRLYSVTFTGCAQAQ